MNVSVFRAIYIWSKTQTRTQVLKAVGMAAVCLLVVFLAGGLAGGFLHPRVHTQVETVVKTVTVHDIETKTVTVEKPVVKWRTKYVEVQKFDPNTGRLTETIKTGENSGERKEGKTVETATKDRTDTAVDSKTKTETNPEGRWSFRALAGIDTNGGVSAGMGVSYRLIGPLEAGAFGLLPVAGKPTAATVGVSLGLRL